MTKKRRAVIVGAAGRDFHNFNCVFRDDPDVEIVAFTAEQIPGIEGRTYPPELAGPSYPDGIPIRPADDLEQLIAAHHVDEVVYSLSDMSHQDVMVVAARVNAAGVDFRLLGVRDTQLASSKPVVSVCAVRTGCGKSPTSRRVAELLSHQGLRVAVVRHPMPYGDLAAQAVQRFETLDDLKRHQCTIEEMEEYELHIQAGRLLFAGVDYAGILEAAEAEADVILWDGGNNDTSFYRADYEIVLVDPHRPGHELTYYPGRTNLLRANCVVIPKVNTAEAAGLAAVRKNIRSVRPDATVVEAGLALTLEGDEAAVRGRRVLVVEDGPTLTHGGMAYGAGVLAAREHGAGSLVDPRPFLAGSLKETFEHYPEIGPLLPAMGYGDEQVRDLEETIRRTECDAVVIATPIDLRRIVRIDKPVLRVRYEYADVGEPTLEQVLAGFPSK